MSIATLAWTAGFVLIALAVSLWQKLGVERDLLVAALRASVQLLIVGYILKAVFTLHDLWYTGLMIVLMIGVATWNARKRGRGVPGAGWKILLGITATEIVTQSFLLGLHIVPAKPQYVIPISGMIIGNSMIVSGLLLDRMRVEARARRDEIRLVLSLGGTPKQAAASVLRGAVRASMIPTIDSTKTTGLVQLPGMMTGQIIAGADPIQAVRYQILILFAILAAAALTSIILGLLAYPSLFNRYQQLVVDGD